MKKHLALPLALAISTLAACSSMHHKTDDTAMTAPATPAPAPVADSASTSTAPADSSLNANGLANQQQAPADTSSQQDSAKAALAQHILHFDYDQYAIQPADEALLQAHAAYLTAHPQAKVRIEGHTDERGTPEYNMALGQRRAKAVQAYLQTHGVPAGQLTTVSYGLEKPVDPGHSESAWAKNRRVELDYQSEAP